MARDTRSHSSAVAGRSAGPGRRSARSDTVSSEPARVAHHLAQDPLFRVRTVDGAGWIDPYTLAVVATPGDSLDPARDHLLRTRPWTHTRPRSLHDLQVGRWLHFLRTRLREEPRLRCFSRDGRWLNPFSGTWIDAQVVDRRVTPETLHRLATVLAADPLAARGRMLSVPELDRLIQQARGTAAIQRAARATGTETEVPTTRVQMPPPPAPLPAIAPPPAADDGHVTDRIVRQAAAPLPAGADPLMRARRVLERMLPTLPRIDPYRLAVHYEPQAGVGGDFYDAIVLGDGRLLLAVGDVSGHGAEAALLVTSTLKALRFIAPDEDDLVALVARLNENIAGDLLRGHYITLFAALLDPGQGTLECVCAGHHTAMLASTRRRSLLTQVGHHGMALGMDRSERFRASLRPQTIQLAPGDVLVQCTDGLFEARDLADEEFGRLRALGALVPRIEQPIENLPRSLVAAAKAFCGRPLDDDVTVLALRVGG